MSSLSPVTRALLRNPVGRVAGNGITVAVFGCTGQLGRYVCAELGRNGHTMVLPYRGDDLEYRHLKLMGDLGTIATVPFSARDRETIRETVRGADVVINLIGKHYQTKHLLPWWINYTYDDVHVDVAQAIAEVAAEEGVPRFIHHSSIIAKPNSPSIWAASKYRGELAVKRAFPTVNIVRSSALFGPEDQLLTWAAERMKLLDAVPLVENGEAVLQPVFVNDVATAIFNISQDASINGETFEFVGDEEYTYKEIGDYVFDITKREGSFINLPLPAAKLIGKFCEQFPSPVFTEDWAVRLSLDQVKTSDLPGLRELDVTPSRLEKEAPNFLVKFKPGGHFQEVSGYH